VALPPTLVSVPLWDGAAPPQAATTAERPMAAHIASDRFPFIELDLYEGDLTDRDWLKGVATSSRQTRDPDVAKIG
jgi:hypothetical protein